MKKTKKLYLLFKTFNAWFILKFKKNSEYIFKQNSCFELCCAVWTLSRYRRHTCMFMDMVRPECVLL